MERSSTWLRVAVIGWRSLSVSAWIREARKRGLAFVVSVDAHSTRDLANVRFGVDTARRGWLQRSHVLNTLEAPEFAARVHPLSGRS